MKEKLDRVPVPILVRVACYLAIAALLLMMWSVLIPNALPVVLGMSVGQGLGVLGFLCYGLAILGEMRRKNPGAETASEATSPDDPD